MVITLDELLALMRDEMGLPVDGDDTERRLDEVAGWDSVHLLWLMTLLEKRTGRSVQIADMLKAQSLRDLHTRAVAA